MKTAVNLTPIDFASNATSQNKSSSSAGATTPFQQVLSNEITQKNNVTNNKNNNNNGVKNTASAPNNSAHAANNAGKSQSKNTEAANTNDNKVADANGNAETATTTSKASVNKNSDDDSADKSSAATDAAQNDSAQLIAFVADVSQFANRATPTATATSAASEASADSAGTVALTGDGSKANGVDAAILDASKLKDLVAQNTAATNDVSDAPATLATDAKAVPTSFDSALSDAQKSAKDRIVTDTNTKPDALADKSTKTDKNSAGKKMDSLITDATVAGSDKLTATIADQKSAQMQTLSDSKTQALDKLADTAATPAVQNFAQQLAINTRQLNGSIGDSAAHLTPAVGTPAWDQAVGQKVVWMVAGGQQTAELTLNPPDLGPLQVVLSINNDQANATFIAAQPEVRDALESALPKLRQMMSEAGIQLSGFSVGSQASNQNNQAQNAFTDPGARSSSRSGSNKNDDSDTGLSSVRSGTSFIRSTRGAVDTFA